ncbi:hypothetical protein [Actinoplanes awajinensis]|uniref:hypothetical protein n=1 Tax=Actinoplanes awajinensis TaxID=135946 RepID=UPI0018DD567C|nr:hypothetical protein [Actinoplanes awajinensis]
MTDSDRVDGRSGVTGPEAAPDDAGCSYPEGVLGEADLELRGGVGPAVGGGG